MRFLPKYGTYGVWPNASSTEPPRKTTRSARAKGATVPRGERVRIFHLEKEHSGGRTPVLPANQGRRQLGLLLVADVTVAETVAATFASLEKVACTVGKRPPSAPRSKPCA